MTPGDVKPSSLPGAAQTEEGLPKPPIGEANVELARQLEEMRRKEAEQKSPEVSDPLGARPPLSGLFSPLPQTPGASPSNVIDSPTLLPSDQDRELARRLQGGIGGLGAIA